MTRPIVATAALALAACSPGGTAGQAGTGDPGEMPSTSESDPPAASEPIRPAAADDPRPFARIAPDATVHFTGNEPFWGGQVAGAALTYSTPESPDGTAIAVERFAGRGGVSWSGVYGGAPFSLAVTPGTCSDGMSDRTYPYVATLMVQGEQRNGCAWTDSEPFSAPPGYQG